MYNWINFKIEDKSEFNTGFSTDILKSKSTLDSSPQSVTNLSYITI